MPRSRLERIRDCIRRRQYDMTQHALDEMAEDLLDILDVESAILTGELERIERYDPRGTKCVVRGLGEDRRTAVGVVGRLVARRRFLIITVYKPD
jgi:hypothetical protein